MKKYESYFIGLCDNCGQDHVKIRRIEAIGVFKESRGFYNICFGCFKPRVEWSDKHGTFYSPTDKIQGPNGVMTLLEGA